MVIRMVIRMVKINYLFMVECCMIIPHMAAGEAIIPCARLSYNLTDMIIQHVVADEVMISHARLMPLLICRHVIS